VPSGRTSRWAYAWWVLGLGGLLGLHRVYLGQPRRGLLHALTLGGLGVLAARDLVGMQRLVDRANDVQRVATPSPWARAGWQGRWLPIMWRGRLVALAFVLSLVLAGLGGLPTLVGVLLTWPLAVWVFAVGLTLGGRLLPHLVPLVARWHYRFAGRAPGEPRARLEQVSRETIRVDPVPDEAFLPIAAALAFAFQLVEWGPQVPLLGRAYELGLLVVPLVAGLVLPLLRAPPGTRFRSVRRTPGGQVSSSRPVGQRLAMYFGLTFVLTSLLQAWVAREAGVFTFVFALVVPILLGTTWYVDDRLARDVGQVETGLDRHVEAEPEEST